MTEAKQPLTDEEWRRLCWNILNTPGTGYAETDAGDRITLEKIRPGTDAEESVFTVVSLPGHPVVAIVKLAYRSPAVKGELLMRFADSATPERAQQIGQKIWEMLG